MTKGAEDIFQRAICGGIFPLREAQRGVGKMASCRKWPVRLEKIFIRKKKGSHQRMLFDCTVSGTSSLFVGEIFI
jgi:hypothetical protein